MYTYTHICIHIYVKKSPLRQCSCACPRTAATGTSPGNAQPLLHSGIAVKRSGVEVIRVRRSGLEITRVRCSGLEVVQLVHRQEKLPGDLVYQSGNWCTRSPGNVTVTSPGNALSSLHAGFAVQGSGIRV